MSREMIWIEWKDFLSFLKRNRHLLPMPVTFSKESLDGLLAIDSRLAKLEKVESLLRGCNTEIIPLKDGGWEIYADFGENSNSHIKTDAATSLWDALLGIDSPYNRALEE
jgi:hypothetical protein